MVATSLPELPLATYRLRFRALEPLQLPAWPRSLWHGLFGLHLRRLSCSRSPDSACQDCPERTRCAYARLFSGPRPPGADLMRRYQTIPVPHVFHFEAPLPQPLPAGEPFALDLALVGDGNDHLAAALQALAAAALQGLGRRRGVAVLEGVEQRLPDADPRPILGAERAQPPLPPRMPPLPPPPGGVHIRLNAPYKAAGDLASSRRFDLERFLMALVRRISLLQYFYTGRPLEAPFRDLKALAGAARASAWEIRFHPGRRRSAGHRGAVDTGGLRGWLDLPLAGLEDLWPYLWLGQWVNVGKNASMGFGAYVFTALSGDPEAGES